MFITKSIPFTASLRKGGINAFQGCNFLEMGANGLRCITFKIKGETSYDGDGDYDGDIIPITFPAGMKRFLKPDSTDENDFLPSRAAAGTFVPIDLTTSDKPLSLFLLHGLNKRTDEIPQIFEQSLYGNHLCTEPLGIRGNGETCSTKTGIGTLEEPIVFYLKMELTPGKIAHGFWPGKLDHFLIPTILPNRTILWIALENFEEDSGERNMEAINRWTSTSVSVKSSGKCFFIDDASILLTMEMSEDGTETLASLIGGIPTP